MPLYEYRCPRCKEEWEAYNSIERRNEEEHCGVKSKMIFNTPPMTTKDRLFTFTDQDTFERPVHIRGKDHWKRELKKRGLTDDKQNFKQKTKGEKKKEYKKAVGEALRDRRTIKVA